MTSVSPDHATRFVFVSGEVLREVKRRRREIAMLRSFGASDLDLQYERAELRRFAAAAPGEGKGGIWPVAV